MNFKNQFKRRMKYNFVFYTFLCLLLGVQASAQSGQAVTITGKITDDAGMALPGVNIVEKGTTNGASSDFEGSYSIKVSSKNATLLFSYLGFKDQTQAIAGKSVINISLAEESNALNEVVVVGYGTVKKSDLTGTVSTIDAKTVTERSTTSVLEGIQGTVAGVQIASTTGRLGDGYNMVIRGKNSLSLDTNPLFVVDGVPTDDIDFLNPQDIARMDILKDASSTAIYGSRGSNGVVIVTTKSGTTAKPGMTVSFDSYIGGVSAARLPKMMSGQKWWTYHQSAYMNAAKAMTTTPDQLATAVDPKGENTVLLQRVANNDTFDWYDAVLQDGLQQNNYLSLSGKSENGMSYNLAIGAQGETGTLKNESIDRYTFKGGLNHKINEKFSTGFNMTLTQSTVDQGSAIAMQEAFRMSPFYTPYDLQGNLFPQPGKLTDEDGKYLVNKTSTYNPLLQIDNATDETKRWNAVGNVYFEYKPIEWLALKTAYAATYDNLTRGQAWGAQTFEGTGRNNLPSAQQNTYENFAYTWDNSVTFTKTLNEKHNLTVLGLQSLFSDTTNESMIYSQNMPFDTGYHNIGSGTQATYNLGNSFAKQTLSSYAVRVNYGYDDRYLITLSNRWDGSSLLSDGNKWESFPSAALAWRVSQESFMSNQQVVSDLKARVSYGYTGNNKVNPYQTSSTLTNQNYYDYNGNVVTGWTPGSLANSALGWEKTREFNIGLDFGFLNNRITGSVDLYDRLSDNLLMVQQLPIETGWGEITSNVGSISNKGIEALLTTKNIKTSLVSWETTFVFTKNKNAVESIYGQSLTDDPVNNLFIGKSIDSKYNYVFDGIWQADQKTEAATFNQTEGQARVKDLNGDGKITEDDRTIMGSSDPKWSGSLTSRLSVGNFDFTVSAITNQGVFAYSPYHENFTDFNDRGRQKADVTWYIPENTAGLPVQITNDYPMAKNEGSYWNDSNVGNYRDASFVKIKNISLGYNFGQSFLEKFKMKQFRVYANVLNPFVFTKYDGYDPEWAEANLAIGRASTITYQLGFSIKL